MAAQFGRQGLGPGLGPRLARVRRLASCGIFVTDSGMYSTDKHRNGKRRAEETGGCVHAEGSVYGMDMRLFSDRGCEILRCSIHTGYKMRIP